MSATFFNNHAEIVRLGFIGWRRWGIRRVRQLIEEGQLRHGDLSVLLGLMEQANRRTGLVPVSALFLSEMPGMPGRTTISYALRRLETAGLVRRVSSSRQSSTALFLLSPELYSGAREELVQQHYRAWARPQDALPPPPVTAGAIAAGHSIAATA
jgi:predicted transcriptional regulator